jgi:hypothetical protein
VKKQILALIAGLVTITVTLASAQAVLSNPHGRKLFKDHHLLLALAAVRGEKDVLLIIASLPGANAKTAEEVINFGGAVHFGRLGLTEAEHLSHVLLVLAFATVTLAILISVATALVLLASKVWLQFDNVLEQRLQPCGSSSEAGNQQSLLQSDHLAARIL